MYYPGEKVNYTVGDVSFQMAFVPGGKTFPTGETNNGAAMVPNAYWMGETEVTYELWYKVYSWATTDAGGGKRADGGVLYVFTFDTNRDPRAGDDGVPGSDTGSQEPVTYVNWRHAMIWCNALTEYYNITNGDEPDLDPVYYTDAGYSTLIRSANYAAINTTPGGQDNPYVKETAKGFRLVTINEWELAARWRNDSINTVDGYADPWFTRGDSASGAEASTSDLTATKKVAWCDQSHTKVVKDIMSNSLGLYDMSGNVWELCFDWYTQGSTRVGRAGCYFGVLNLEIGKILSQNPTLGSGVMGFRLARSAP